MRLLEYQAKRILAEYGIPVPEGNLLRSAADLAGVPLPVVLKAQVPAGGRGKAGGIQIATGRGEAANLVGDMLDARIRGYPVSAILAEAQTDINREIYLALLLDKRTNLPLVMASASGGVDIEQVARESPEQIVAIHVDPCIGLQPYAIRYAAEAIGVGDVAGLGSILRQMWIILAAYDATLVEINPLAETPAGLVALDAKIVLDEKAAFRHSDLFASLRKEQAQLGSAEHALAEQLAQERGITYVLLDGDVGLVADGAGTGMLILDLIQDAGGRAANFCEMGGLASPEVMCQAIEVVLANPGVRALLISLIGGLTRMDEMAEGIVRYLEHQRSPVPLVVRMCGTQEEVGKATLQDVGLGAFDDLPEAVRHVVALAREA
jgi:succinyl-CoA synthetase beta subunit